MQELFESKALIYFPKDKDQFHYVSPDELQAMTEMDKEDPMNSYGDKAYDTEVKSTNQANSFDLTASQFITGTPMANGNTTLGTAPDYS